MTAQIIPFSGSMAPKQPARLQRMAKAERKAAREAIRVRECEARRAELKEGIAGEPTFWAWHASLDDLSVRMDLPHIHIKDAEEMFERLFQNGAMRLRY